MSGIVITVLRGTSIIVVTLDVSIGTFADSRVTSISSTRIIIITNFIVVDTSAGTIAIRFNAKVVSITVNRDIHTSDIVITGIFSTHISVVAISKSIRATKIRNTVITGTSREIVTGDRIMGNSRFR